MVSKRRLLMLLLLTFPLFAQVQTTTLGGVPVATFATPPSSPGTNTTYLFTDASSVGTCTGGGFAYAICVWNGSSWVTPSGAGAGGTVTSVGLVGTANEVTITGASPITGSGSWTVSLNTTQAAVHTWTLAQTFSVAPIFSTAVNLPTASTLNSVAFTSASTTAIGTSGATIPLLSTANTWTLGQTFSAIATFNAALLSKGDPVSGVSIDLAQTSSGQPNYIRFANSSGSFQGLWGLSNGSGQIINGSAANDMGFLANGGKILFSTDSGSTASLILGANSATLSGSITASNGTFSGTASAALYATATNCANGASPAVCAAAPVGAVAIPTGVNSTLVVNTTAVTANSRITLTPDDSLTIASTTCNSTLATLVGGMAITARTAATSFTISFSGTITTNPVCLSYKIEN